MLNAVMSITAKFILIVTTVSYTIAQYDLDCKAQIQAFVACEKTEAREAALEEMEEANGTINDQIDSCFTKENCFTVDWNGVPDRSLYAKSRETPMELLGRMNSSTQQCIVTTVRGHYNDRLQQCVSMAIPNLVIPGLSPDLNEETGEVKSNKNKLAEYRLRLRSAIKNCPGKSSAIRKCIREITTKKRHTCEIRAKCIANLKAECLHIWNNAYKEPICTCVTDVTGDLRKEISNLPVEAAENREELISERCGVELPVFEHIDADKVTKLQKAMLNYLSLFEDRVVQFCHNCE